MRETWSRSDYAASNIRGLRIARKMTFVELSARMEAEGQPIPVLGLRRIERRARRIDLDELDAFATVFGVEPWSLTSRVDCLRCEGKPPVGYICQDCGARGERGGFVNGADFVLGPE